MDFSRLNVTALDNNKNNIEKTAIVFVGFKPTYFSCKALTYKNRKKLRCNYKKILREDMLTVVFSRHNNIFIYFK